MKRSLIFFVCAAVLFFFSDGAAIAQSAEVKAMLKDANTMFRNADKDFMAGKMESARDFIVQAKEFITKAREGAPEDFQVVSLEKRIDSLAEKIEKRLAAKGTASPAASGPSSGAAPARLPATAGRYLMEADRALKKVDLLLGPDRGKQAPDRLAARVREALAPAEENLAKLLSEFPDFKDHPDVAPKVERMEAARHELETIEGARASSAAASGAAAAARDAESGEWMKKLRPYVASKSNMDDAPFVDAEKELIPYGGFDLEARELARRHRLFAEAAASVEEYRGTKKEEPTEILAETIREIGERAGQFAAQLKSLGESALGEGREKIGFARERVDENMAREAKGEDFNALSRDVFLGIGERLDSAAVFLPPDHPGLLEARRNAEELAALDGKLREKLVEKTRMIPDRFTGKEGEEIRAAARSALEKDAPGAALLRMTVISPEWKEEWKYQEGADRIYHLVSARNVTVQAALKGEKGVELLTLFVYSRRNPDWSLQPMEGYVVYRDKMLEENVEKE